MAERRKIRWLALPIMEVLGLLLIMGAVLLFATQIAAYSAQQNDLPATLELGGVDVGGLPRAEAQARLEQAYAQPITVTYREQTLTLSPVEVGFSVNTEGMLAQAEQIRTEGDTFWSGFWAHIWQMPEEPVSVPLDATYNQQALRTWLADAAAQYDSPPTTPQPVLSSLSFEGGQPGYTLDQESAFYLLDEALYRMGAQTVALPIDEVSAQQAGMDTLGELIVDYLEAQNFENVASVYVVDLETGEELALDLDFRSGEVQYLDCEIAFAGMSTMKISVMTQFFRTLSYVPGLGDDNYNILYQTMTQSGNTTANFMLQVAGYDNIFVGVRELNTMLDELGLDNTFMASYYDDEAPPEYYSTPAREAARAGECVNTNPDPYMQTTTRDLTMLLDMIYQCATNGGGTLRTVYPEQITQEDCKEMLLALSGNEKGSLIMAGVPTDVEVAHKHGWTYDTHGDAGIVFSPGGDYAMAIMLWANVDWYPVLQSFPLIEDISAMTFNYFNPDMVDAPRRGLYPDEIGQVVPTEGN